MQFLPKTVAPNFDRYLHINNKSIKVTYTMKFLGLMSNPKLSWESHINKETAKLSTVRNIGDTLSVGSSVFLE